MMSNVASKRERISADATVVGRLVKTSMDFGPMAFAAPFLGGGVVGGIVGVVVAARNTDGSSDLAFFTYAGLMVGGCVLGVLAVLCLFLVVVGAEMLIGRRVV